MLAAREWPGNVRELRNEAERYVFGLSDAFGLTGDASNTLADRVNDYERALISASISANNGRLKETYESLGISRKSLYDKMQRHGLSRRGFTSDE